jgi:hypothetical protein
MSLPIQETDLKKCPHCGGFGISCAYWDEKKGQVGEAILKIDFPGLFEKRDYKGRLVVFDYDQAMKESHFQVCKKMPATPKPDEMPEEKRRREWA